MPAATAILDRFNINTIDGFDVRRQVLGLVAEHLRPSAFHKTRDTVKDGAFRRLAARVDLELLVRFARSDCHGRGGVFDCSAMDWFLERARALGVEHAPPAPLLLGRHLLDLGVRPGPRMGLILRAVYERQLDGAVVTLAEAMAAGREEVAAAYRRAFDLRSSRAEPLYHLAVQSRREGDAQAAYRYAKQACLIPVPDGDLGLERVIYSLNRFDELSEAAFALGSFEEAMAACDQILDFGRVDKETFERVMRRRKCS